LVFPGAKTIHDKSSCPTAAAASTAASHLSPAQAAVLAASLPKVAAAQTVVDAICHKQVCLLQVMLHVFMLVMFHFILHVILHAMLRTCNVPRSPVACALSEEFIRCVNVKPWPIYEFSYSDIIIRECEMKREGRGQGRSNSTSSKHHFLNLILNPFKST
jgi:hypothetical protein